jgi:hypothetical protein
LNGGAFIQTLRRGAATVELRWPVARLERIVADAGARHHHHRLSTTPGVVDDTGGGSHSIAQALDDERWHLIALAYGVALYHR